MRLFRSWTGPIFKWRAFGLCAALNAQAETPILYAAQFPTKRFLFRVLCASDTTADLAIDASMNPRFTRNMPAAIEPC
jgi:hypothetical protein